MHRLLPVLFTLILMCATVYAQKDARVAVLRESTASSFWEEIALLENELSIDKFTIDQLEEISRKLSSYDLVIIGTQANYKADRDFTIYDNAWRTFLERGGVLLLLDANYIQTTERVLGKLAPGQLGAQWHCGTVEELRQLLPEIAAGCLFDFPYGGNDAFPLKLRGAHFVNPPAEWQPLLRCQDNMPVMLEYRLGRGRIIATTLFALFSVDGKKFTRSLVCNLLFRQKCQRVGLEIRSFGIDYSKNNAVLHLGVENLGTSTTTICGRAIFNGSDFVPEMISMEIPAGECRTLHRHFDIAVPITAGIVLTSHELAFTGYFAPRDERPVWALPARVFPTQAQALRIALTHQNNDQYISAELLNDNDRAIPLALDSPAAMTLLADLSAETPGQHNYRLRLTRNDGEKILLNAQEATIVPTGTRADIDERGNIRWDGKDYFPLCLYQVSRAVGQNSSDRLRCLEYAHKYGYNTVFVASLDEKSDREFMVKAQRYGICVFFDVLDMDIIRRHHADWKAVISWIHEMDEPEHWGYTPESVRARGAKIHALAPQCLVFSSMETAATVRRYAGVTDIIATHGYPVPHNPLRLVTDKMRLLVELSRRYSFAPIGTIQCFGYPGNPAGGYPALPTASQMRNMVYQAVAANVKGLFFYTFADGGFDLEKNSEMDKFMRGCADEIKPLLPFLQHGDYTILESNNADIVGACWRLGEKTLVIWVNTSNQPRTLKNPQWQNNMQAKYNSQSCKDGNMLSLHGEEVVVWQK